MTALSSFLNSFSIDSLLAAIAIVVSLIAIIQTSNNSKKAQKQNDEGLRLQIKQYNDQMKSSKEVEKIQEQPYFVFVKTDYSEDSKGTLILNIVIKNKGRGAA